MVRATERVRIGTGTTGPGSALWVEAEVVESAGAHGGRAKELALHPAEREAAAGAAA